jgi:phosphatidylglycerophosphate synthase
MMNRRPLASRRSGWAQTAALRLTRMGISPNAISVAGTGFAALGGLLFLAVGASGPVFAALCLILAALACQARLICNLLDGMVAVEGGRAAPDGPFWNEAPDRLSDILLFAGAGVAAGSPSLGLGCAAAAVLTAYLRELGRAEGLPPDFGGPMAKQHRMATLTAAAVLAVVWPGALPIGLWIVLVGTVLTAALRSRRMIAALGRRRSRG